MFLFDMIKAVLLGIIQGITEWLPVSSTGHMILFNSFFPMSSSLAKPDTPEFAFWGLFLVVIQLGSILAVCVLYFHKLNPFSSRKSISEKRSTWDLWFHVLVASIPGIIGIFLNDYVEKYMNNAIVVAIALIVFGIGFIVLESTKHHHKYRRVGEITYQTAFLIGLFQLIAALVPGTSRSGATILGASILGCSRFAASEFSFFMAIPAMAGASGLKFLKYFMHYGFSMSGGNIALLVVASIIAFVVSMFAIRFLMNYIRNHDFKIFGYYRIVVGVAVLICYFLGVLNLSAI